MEILAVNCERLPENFFHDTLKVRERVPIIEVDQSPLPSSLVNFLLRLREYLRMEQKGKEEGLRGGTGLPRCQPTSVCFDNHPTDRVRCRWTVISE